jgi:hypothetical protein
MQGKITVQTSQQFMRRFFAELAQDGQIDRAVAVARWEVREQPDAWMPVLFTRLISGRIWSTGSAQRFERWPGLITSIRERRCTPILGPGLIEFLLGSPREIAQRWADTYRFPMAPEERADLPQVAQFLAVANSDPQFPRAELVNHLQREMRERYSARLPTNLDRADLNALITEVGRQRREQDETEPHRVLAKLQLPIYVTTNPDDLLAEALRAEGRHPEIVLFRWDDMAEWPESVYDQEPT